MGNSAQIAPAARRLFVLLRAALGTTPTDGSPFDDACGADWEAVYRLASAQGLLAVAWDGFERLRKTGAISDACLPPQALRRQWAFNTERIEERYRRQEQAANRLGQSLEREGIRALLFKGLSLSRCYPVPSHRECGDIDLYPLDGSYKRVCLLAAENGASKAHVSPKHAEFTFAGATFENHRRFLNDFLAPRNRRINRLLKATLCDSEPLSDCASLRRPAYRFDELFIAAHAAIHFANEGIVLRHVVDWLLLLRHAGRNPDMERLRACGLARFAGILNRICRDELGYDLHETCCTKDDTAYYRVLRDILTQGPARKGGGTGWSRFLQKCRRFAGRRWAYPIIGDSFTRAMVRSIRAHLLQPDSLFGRRR